MRAHRGQGSSIVSFEGIASVDLELYRGGIIVMDEIRSLAAIPGDGTMEKAEQPSRTEPCVRALGMLCAGIGFFTPRNYRFYPQKSGFAHVMTCYDMLCTRYDTL